MNSRIAKRLFFLVVLLAMLVAAHRHEGTGAIATEGAIKLPEPRHKSEISLEETLSRRRSVREYGTRALRPDEISQLLWAAQGITAPWGGRTAPSAGALYPLEIYLVVGDVHTLSPGLYHYDPRTHTLGLLREGDMRKSLSRAALGQAWVRKAQACVIIAAVVERTARKYRRRALRYVHMEVGCACQNIHLQCESLDLGTVAVGAFDDSEVARILGVGPKPLLLMPVGPRKESKG